jgi:hypothetical protein
MSQLFTIENDKIVINKLALRFLEGDILLAGNLETVGHAKFDTIEANEINVKNLVTSAGAPIAADVGNWATNTEEELNGRGLSWAWGDGSVQLQYRTGNKIWTGASIDLDKDQSFKIDDTPVLSAGKLGDTVVNSKLRTVGKLNSLAVSGDASIGDFAFFNSNFNRLGIGLEEPKSAISILENNVEIGIGSPDVNLAAIGTCSNHDLQLLTDGHARVVIKNSGEVVIGNEHSKDGSLVVNGTLKVFNLVSDTRVERSSSLHFRATRDQSIFGLGIVWANLGVNAPKQLMLRSEPDRLWTTESIDIGPEQSYFIDGVPAVTPNGLGRNILSSNLIKVGTLQGLIVDGKTTIIGDLEVNQGQSSFKSVVVGNTDQNIIISHDGFGSLSSVKISSAGYEALYSDKDMVTLGDYDNQRRPIKLYGSVSIGVRNPDPKIKLTVAGDVSIGNKKFTNGASAPKDGEFTVGDICWNQNPAPTGYVGWVCVENGAPGKWLPFGAIASQ